MKLSDSFETANEGYEWTAHMLNINSGHNQKILEDCPALKGYVMLVQYIREYQAIGGTLSDAVNKGIDRCIKENLLKEYLLKKKSEVKLMLLTEFDEELFIKTMKEEGEEHINRLYLQLIAEKRLEDLERAAKDRKFREALYKEYGL